MLSCSAVSDSLQPHGLVACQAPLSMGIPQGRIWNGLPCPPPEDLPNPEIKPRSPPLQQNSLPAEPPGKPSEAPRIYFCDNVFFAISLSLSRLL